MNVLKQMIFTVIVFASATSWAMDVNAEIEALKFERFQMLNKIENTAKGSSTTADRAFEKRSKAQLSVINTKIMLFEQFKAKL